MGMAPYGQPHYQDKVYKLVKVNDDGSFHLNLDYFSYHYSDSQTFNQRFVELFGPPRDSQSEFITTLTHPNVCRGETEGKRNQYYADVAASIQRVTEKIFF